MTDKVITDSVRQSITSLFRGVTVNLCEDLPLEIVGDIEIKNLRSKDNPLIKSSIERVIGNVTVHYPSLRYLRKLPTNIIGNLLITDVPDFGTNPLFLFPCKLPEYVEKDLTCDFISMSHIPMAEGGGLDPVSIEKQMRKIAVQCVVAGNIICKWGNINHTKKIPS